MRTRYMINNQHTPSRQTVKQILLRMLTYLFLLIAMQVVLGGCATNYAAPYRFTSSSIEKRHHTTKLERPGDHRQQETGRLADYAVNDSSTVNQPGLTGQSIPEHPAPTCAAGPIPFPLESVTICEPTPIRHSAIGRFLEGKIEDALIAAISILVKYPWLRLKLILAAPYVEDAILDLADWLMAEPLPQT